MLIPRIYHVAAGKSALGRRASSVVRYFNEEHIKDNGLFFYSVNSYHEYVTTYMCHHGIAGISTLSLYYSYGSDLVSGRMTDWTAYAALGFRF